MRLLSVLLAFAFVACSTQRSLEKRQAEEEKRVICYYTNWSAYRTDPTAKFTPANINPYLCSHLLYAFVKIDLENSTIAPFDSSRDYDNGGFMEFNSLKGLNPALKTMLSLGGWNEGSSRFSAISSNPSMRSTFVKNAIGFIRKNSFDGLDLCWQYPGFREGSMEKDKENYALLIKELREGFEEESAETGNERLILSIVMSAFPDYVDKGYDIPTLNKYIDFINMIGYDYFLSTGPFVHHHAPLYPLLQDLDDPINSQLNADASVRHLLSKGARPELVNLGIPTYGRFYKLEDPDENEPGSSAVGEGVGVTTVEPGYKTYYEICQDVKSWTKRRINATAMGPYAYEDDKWVSYDDVESVKLKAAYVKMKKLGGLMFWTIDDDDFRGRCDGIGNPLIRAGREAMVTPSARPRTEPSGNTVTHRPPSSSELPPASTPSELPPPPSSPRPSSSSPRPPSSSQRPPFPTSPPFDVSSYKDSSLPLRNTTMISVLFPHNSYFQDIKIWITNHFHIYSGPK